MGLHVEDWYWWSWLGYKLNCIYLLNVVREYWLKFVAARTNLGDERNGKIEKKLNLNINSWENGPYINSAAYIVWNVVSEYYFKSLADETTLEDDTNGKLRTKL